MKNFDNNNNTTSTNKYDQTFNLYLPMEKDGNKRKLNWSLSFTNLLF